MHRVLAMIVPTLNLPPTNPQGTSKPCNGTVTPLQRSPHYMPWHSSYKAWSHGLRVVGCVFTGDLCPPGARRAGALRELHRSSSCRGPNGSMNLWILQTTISGIPLILAFRTAECSIPMYTWSLGPLLELRRLHLICSYRCEASCK